MALEENQIRKYKHGKLPNIKLAYFNKEKDEWLCVFQEEFIYPYIHLTKKKIEESTELIEN